MLFQSVLFTLVIIANFVLGAIVLARKYDKLSGMLFGVAVLSISVWAVGDMLLLGASSPGMAELGGYLFYIAPTTIPVTLWFFSMIFPEERRLQLGPLIFGTLSFLALGVAILSNLDWFIESITIKEGLNIVTPQTPGFFVYAAYLTLFFLLTYITLFRKGLKVKGRAKLQVNYVMLGAMLGGVPALFTNLVLPPLGKPDIIWLGPLFTLLSVYCVMIAMVRHKMFDIRLLIARSLAYLLALITLASIYGLVVFTIIERFFDLEASVSASIFISVATALASLTFPRVKAFFDATTNKAFFRDAYAPQAFFDDFNKALVSTVDLDELLKNTTGTIESYLKAEYCFVDVRDPSSRQHRVVGTMPKTYSEKDMSEVRHILLHRRRAVVIADDIPEESDSLKRLLAKNDIAILVRLSQETSDGAEGIGYAVLGVKKSGNPYDKQDVRVLSAAVNELTVAIQNSLRFEEIKHFNKTLQEKIDEATRQLRQKNERLRMLDQTKDDFISMASHQLRTPLTSVKGYVSMVLDGDAGKVNQLQRKLLNQSYVSSQRMVYLISDLLNVSRLRTGKFELEEIPTDLAKIIEEEVSQLKETAQARNLMLTYTKPDTFPVYMLDETKLRQVIMNFIDNAIYYTPSGGSIDVKLADNEKSIELTVKDTGIGVPRRDVPHMFSKYFRARNAKVARPDGTGLGLFMAKKVVVAHGGAVIFKTREGHGSTFGFSLPKSALKAVPKSSARNTKA